MRPRKFQIFTINSFQSHVTSHELQRNYRRLLVRMKNRQEPVFITRYLKQEAVLLGYDLWEQACAVAQDCQRLEHLTASCPRCSLILGSLE